MRQPTRQEIIDAHNTLSHLFACLEMGCKFGPATTKANENVIKKALLPIPPETMAEVEWDDEKHYLADAETESGVKVIMLSQSGDFIRCIQPPNAGDVVIGFPREELTPTGRHYTPTQEN